MALTLTNIKFDAVSGIWTALGTNDGSAAAQSIYPGFKPRKVHIDNLTDPIVFNFTENMAAGKAIQTVGAGTTTYLAANGVTLLDNSSSSGATTAAVGQSPSAAQGGITLGTAICAASKVLSIELYR
jgi:hypothetical protein